MHRFMSKLLVAFITVVMLLGSAGVAVAQQKSEKKTKETVAMSQAVYEKLTEIQEMIEAKDFASAQRLIDDLKGKKGLSEYELAQVYNISGYSYYLQERYDDAIRSYDQMLAQPNLPEALTLSTLKTKAQLQFTQSDYEGALVTVRKLLQAVTEPSADVLMLEGQALFQLARYDEALTPIKAAIDLYRSQGQIPKENWLLLLRVIYFEQKDYEAMIDVVRELLVYYPKDTYILTLAGIYSELGDTKKQLALTEVLYEKGLISTASNVTNLANLYLLHGLPYKAAVVLEKEINDNIVDANERSLRLLSPTWYHAREHEKAIPPPKRAPEMSEDGELYVRLAQAYINLEQWGEAATAVQQALKIGGLKRVDTANIMLGMALFNQKRLEQARRAFASAAQYDRSKRAASQWIAYVDSEIKRRDLLQQDMPDYTPRERDAFEDVVDDQ